MRRGQAPVRPIAGDLVYNDPKVERFINSLMTKGKKNLARTIFYTALERITQKMGRPGVEVWKEAMENVSPQIEAVRRRARGAIRQVPAEVRPPRRRYLATTWIIAAARQAKPPVYEISQARKSEAEGTPGEGVPRKKRCLVMAMKLASEIMAAASGEGVAMKSKNNAHKVAEANKAFSHLKI